MKSWTLPFRKWDEFWYLEGSPHSLGIFRLLLGVYWLVRWLLLAPYVELFFSDQGLRLPLIEAPQSNLEGLLAWLTPPASASFAWLLYLLALASLACWTAGLKTRAALAAFLTLFAFHYLAYLHMLNTSYDRIFFILTAILLLSPCGSAVSVDAWLKARRGIRVPMRAPLWTQRLICVQVALFYLGTGLAKIATPAWSDGSVIFNALMGEWATPMGFWLVGQEVGMGWFDLASLSTQLFEVCAAFLLFHPRWQWAIISMGIAFHLSIALLLSIWEFLPITFAYILFIDPAKTARFCQRREVG